MGYFVSGLPFSMFKIGVFVPSAYLILSCKKDGFFKKNKCVSYESVSIQLVHIFHPISSHAHMLNFLSAVMFILILLPNKMSGNS